MFVKKNAWLAISIFCVMSNLSALEMDWGRYYPQMFEKEKNSFTFNLNYGWMTDFKAEVSETRNNYARYLEFYSFEDLGFDDKYAIYGFQMEKKWKYLSVALELDYFNPKEDIIAGGDFAIAMEEVDYNGQTYQYMLIPEGLGISTDIKGAILELNTYITPFFLQVTEAMHFTPWFNLGLYSVAGKIKIDAGEPHGITLNENNPNEYVIGGKAEGWFGAGMPEIGFGGECVFEFLTHNNTEYDFVFNFNIVNYNWEGSTDDFAILNVQHAKDIDLNYTKHEFKFYWEFPVFKSSSFLAGIKYQIISADVTIEDIKQTQTNEGDSNDRYNKEIELDVNNLTFFVSIRT